jgi:hypothetical protein
MSHRRKSPKTPVEDGTSLNLTTEADSLQLSRRIRMCVVRVHR